jgi:O-acetyl-ADP-ribose deacetylase (regulator of RNase III)
MKIAVGNTTLELVQGDITTQEVDAIVNAANSGLAGGGGVDGAIHAVGGPSIMEECRSLGGCPTGQAKLTGGGDLPARFVIHAVGPIYNNGHDGEAELLAIAYRNSLNVAHENGVRSIAFPSLSTGAYRYPLRDAAHIALSAVIEFSQNHPDAFDFVRFVLFDAKTLTVFEAELQKLQP